MLKISFIISFVFVLQLHLLYSQSTDSLSFPTRNITHKEFFEKWYLHTNFEHYIDNYCDYTIHQIETAGDFSQPQPYTFSINGGSYKWNQYYFNNFKINDLYFPGNALHKPYLFDNDVSIDIYNNSVQFFSNDNDRQKAYIQWNHGTLGDRMDDADYIINTIAGHGSPYQRLYGTPINFRKRVEDNILLMLHNIIETKKGNLYQSFYFNAGQHMLTGFDYKGINSYYPENYLQFHVDGNLPVIADKLFDYNGYLFTYLERDQLFSEYYYAQNETAKLKSINLSLYGKMKDYYTTGLNLSLKNISHNTANFSRNYVDIEGEGLEPWYADENIVELSINHKQKKKLNDLFSIQAEFSNALMQFNPKQNSSFNTIYYQPTDTNYMSLYYTEWQHKSFTSALLSNALGLQYEKFFNNKRINLKAEFDITLDGFSVASNTFIKPSWQFAFNTTFQLLPKIKVSVLFGKKQIPFDADYIRFFSADYMNGLTYYWHDINNDKQFQSNEKGDLFTTTGGKYHHISDGIQQPYEFYFDIPVEIRVGKRSLFTISAQYRQYRNLWGITYDAEASAYGKYSDPVNIGMYSQNPPDNRQIYFLNNGVVNYTAVNNYSEKMMEGTKDNSVLWDNPFVTCLNIKYEYQGKKLYICASITTNRVEGFGALGNGVLQNNFSVLTESMANPNSYFYYLGRMDVDRSYFGRLLISYAINRHLTMAFQYKYKDGQPFNAFGTKSSSDASGNNQIAIWNNNVKGDNSFTGETSRREDCFYNTELRCKYTFFLKDKLLDINLSFYNLLDLGFQLAEATFPPLTDEGKRKAIDIQIPRGFILSAALRF
ncbi:MAG: hypothetical protein NTZ33_00460 [Bacteroidetes bacterium]|nr:hypothetical protein [Bacteroidota bacterium]